jgi:hypothetical protein
MMMRMGVMALTLAALLVGQDARAAERIRRMGGVLRERAGAERSRRAAEGGGRVVHQAGGEAAQSLWGTRRPRPSSQEGCGRGPGPVGCLETQHHAA